MNAKRIVTVIGVSAALMAAPTATPAQAAPSAGDVSIMSCFGNARLFNKLTGFNQPNGGYHQTTSNCSDINMRPNSTTRVRVCFQRTQACNSFKTAPAGQWTVIASNVVDNAGFYFNFASSGPISGQWAA